MGLYTHIVGGSLKPNSKWLENHITKKIQTQKRFLKTLEEQFKLIIKEIRQYLGANNKTGEGVTLKIFGSASQIPTSFDPSKPNNNIRPDGSSIPGRTSIENNKKLAQARALELANKIKKVLEDLNTKEKKVKNFQKTFSVKLRVFFMV